ncbi:MAG: PIG-L family deacetylase [Planctomycetes bacterium]|nr:PIG-L family deacetylase [Planctomycetota bacterium]
MRTFLAVSLLLAVASLPAQQAEPEAGLVALHQALLDASTDAVVLNVAAHPDDESSRTNTILRRKYGMRVVTAYTTYGDGGQNAIGREIGPELAALRVRETLRAAAMSDVEVRWLGMEDFGFSKTLDETRAKWTDAKLLAAMRQVVDAVDPDFVLTNHSLTQGHGHHRATFWAIDTVLRERAAQKQFVPALLTRAKVDEAQWIVDPSELEPARGETYARLAHRAWTQHVTQGPWGPHDPLQVGKDFWKVVNDDVRTIGAIDGVPPAMPWLWVRPGLAWGPRLPEGARQMDPPGLQKALHAIVAANPHVVDLQSTDGGELRRVHLAGRYREALDRALLALSNVRVESWLARDEIAFGSDGIAHVVVQGVDKVNDAAVRCADRVGTPITAAVRTMVFDGVPVSPAMPLPGLPTDPAPQQAAAPQAAGPAGRFTVPFACAPIVDGPEPRSVVVDVAFTLDGHPLRVRKEFHYTPVPPVTLTWDREVLMVPKGKKVERVLSVAVRCIRDEDTNTAVALSMGPGITAETIPGRLALAKGDAETRVLVRATIDANELLADAALTFRFQGALAALPVRVVDVTVPEGGRIGLVRGPDDTTEKALGDLGVPFSVLDRDALLLAHLDDYATILLDIRAYHHRPELAEMRDRLLAYCRGGGRIVAMYHKPGEWNERTGRPLLAPFPLTIGDERCTEEHTGVTFLQPGHALLTKPHALAAGDFAGWVQERGLNFPKAWDPAWVPLLAMQDQADAKAHEGALLHTQYGQGDFVYCSLALYRQLRVGNVGASRLLVNLLAR